MPDDPNSESNRYGGKYSDPRRYRNLLTRVFTKSKHTLTEDARLCVRTDQRETTLETTVQVLRRVFPDKEMQTVRCPLSPAHQAKPYGRGGAPKQPNCEIDLILKPR